VHKHSLHLYANLFMQSFYFIEFLYASNISNKQRGEIVHLLVSPTLKPFYWRIIYPHRMHLILLIKLLFSYCIN